jgi:hypothetical protein
MKQRRQARSGAGKYTGPFLLTNDKGIVHEITAVRSETPMMGVEEWAVYARQVVRESVRLALQRDPDLAHLLEPELVGYAYTEDEPAPRRKQDFHWCDKWFNPRHRRGRRDALNAIESCARDWLPGLQPIPIIIDHPKDVHSDNSLNGVAVYCECDACEEAWRAQRPLPQASWDAITAIFANAKKRGDATRAALLEKRERTPRKLSPLETEALELWDRESQGRLPYADRLRLSACIRELKAISTPPPAPKPPKPKPSLSDSQASQLDSLALSPEQRAVITEMLLNPRRGR